MQWIAFQWLAKPKIGCHLCIIETGYKTILVVHLDCTLKSLIPLHWLYTCPLTSLWAYCKAHIWIAEFSGTSQEIVVEYFCM